MLSHYKRIRTFYNIYLLSPFLSFDKMVAHRLFCFGCQLIRNAVLIQTQHQLSLSRFSKSAKQCYMKEMDGMTRVIKELEIFLLHYYCKEKLANKTIFQT